MTADQDPHMSDRATQAIIQCLQQPRGQVWPYVLPKVKFSASNFTELLDWGAEQITDPPLAIDLSGTEERDIRSAPLKVGAFLVQHGGGRARYRGGGGGRWRSDRRRTAAQLDLQPNPSSAAAAGCNRQ